MIRTVDDVGGHGLSLTGGPGGAAAAAAAQR